MFSFQTKVSYSRVNRKGIVPYYEVVNYLQDCSTFHADELGHGVDYKNAQKKAWVLISYKIQMIKPIFYGQEIEVGTSPTSFRKLFASRQFYIKDMEGNYLVKADSIWILMDLESRKTVRIAEEDMRGYQLETLFKDIEASRKIKLSQERNQYRPFQVLATYIDSNCHMNNADYLRAVEEFLEDTQRYQQLEIVYHKEAVEDETIIPFLHPEDNGVGISFENKSGELLTEIRFTN